MVLEIVVDCYRLVGGQELHVEFSGGVAKRGSEVPITALLLNTVDLCTESKRCRVPYNEVWRPPVKNLLKFNVNGSVRGKPGPAGIGGVLRDFTGKFLCMFSLYVAVLDSNLAELLAIEKACSLVVSNWALYGLLIDIASDSKVAVYWINDEGICSLNYVNMVYDCRELIRSHGGISIYYISRSMNSFANILAKK
ncbi:hypothetical protein Ddye_027081 [Dipteronia dyeriana]|uniref:RNase H type-1 domain-containing protein n=1 Tax=Dipteronia dyeriana TaxID=168575 RepID=A0AAD9WQ51_9ROSI|nr:hypothetical protein Ddye_027081 [Dipteronia dyeriana]